MTAGQGLLLSRLQPHKLRSAGPGKYSACSPCRDDKRPSLSVTFDGDKVLLYDHGGSTADDVLTALGLTWPEVLPPRESAPKAPPRIAAVYAYKNAARAMAYEVVRFEPKDFRVRRLGENGSYVWNATGITRIPFMLPELLAAPLGDRVFVVEGEKDALNLARVGLVATTNPGGCGSTKLWATEPFRKPFAGRHVAVLADNDEAGRKHAEAVAGALHGVAASVKLVLLPGLPTKGDVSDWLGGDHTVEDLHAVVASASEWTPAQAEPVAVDAAIPSSQDGRRPARSFALTETGASELFADRLKGEIAFVPEWGKWLVWTGTHWRADVAEVAVMEQTKIVARKFIAEAKWAVDHDDARAKALAQFATSAQRRQFRRAVLDLAKSEPGIAVSFEKFDRDHMLLNVINGTLDLRTGQLCPHRREDRITRVLPWTWDPTATFPRWQQFLAEVLPDAETVAFVERAIGYSLTGDVSEHVLFFCYGPGANGKSVFLLALLELLGEYATQAPTSMLLSKQGDAHPTELTTLHNRRVVCCQETPSGRGWAEEILKHVTGGDRISARRMREDFWQFEPTHKLWVSGNHKPIVRGQDEGVWRRLRLIPFERVIPEAERDPKLGEKLRAEIPGILAWAVQGCLAWQRNRLGMSAKVQAATSDYREESDRLGPFVVECCAVEPGAVVPRAALYRAYASWSEAQGERRPMSERDVSELLHGRGFGVCWTRSNGKRCRGWQGLRLNTGNTGNTSLPDFPYERLEDSPRGISRESRRNVLPPVAGDADAPPPTDAPPDGVGESL
jgi:putative DNA primase/helicase